MAKHLVFRTTKVTLNRGTVNAIPVHDTEEVQDFKSDSGDSLIGVVTVVLRNTLDLSTDKDGNLRLPKFYENYDVDTRRLP